VEEKERRGSEEGKGKKRREEREGGKEVRNLEKKLRESTSFKFVYFTIHTPRRNSRWGSLGKHPELLVHSCDHH
jgi:hypothetical protein